MCMSTWRSTRRWCRAQRSEENDWNLSISRYVDTSEEEDRIDVVQAVRKLRELERKGAESEATMNRYLAGLGTVRSEPHSESREDGRQSGGCDAGFGAPGPRQEKRRC